MRILGAFGADVTTTTVSPAALPGTLAYYRQLRAYNAIQQQSAMQIAAANATAARNPYSPVWSFPQTPGTAVPMPAFGPKIAVYPRRKPWSRLLPWVSYTPPLRIVPGQPMMPLTPGAPPVSPFPPAELTGALPVDEAAMQTGDLDAAADDTIFGLPRMVVFIGGAIAAIAAGFFLLRRKRHAVAA